MRTSADALRSIRRYIGVLLATDVPPLWKDEQHSWEVRLWGAEGEFGFPFARVAPITPTTYTGSAAVREAAKTFAVHLYPVPLATPEDSIMEVERVEELLTVAFETGFTYEEPLQPPGRLVAVVVKTGGATAAGSFDYAVTALNASGESVASAVVTRALVAGGYVNLAWAQAAGATSYNVYRAQGGWRLLGNVQTNTFVDDGSGAGTVQSPPLTGTGTARISSAPGRIPLYDYAGVPLDGVNSESYARGPADFLRVGTCPINRIVDPEDDRYWLVTAEPRATWRRSGRLPVGSVPVQSAQVGFDA